MPEVLRRRQADRRALGGGVAPGQVVGVVESREAGVVALVGDEHLRVVALHGEGLGVDLPAEAVSTEPGVQREVHADLVDAEHPGVVAVAALHDRRVVDTVRPRDRTRRDDRIARVPDEHRLVCHRISTFRSDSHRPHLDRRDNGSRAAPRPGSPRRPQSRAARVQRVQSRGADVAWSR